MSHIPKTHRRARPRASSIAASPENIADGVRVHVGDARSLVLDLGNDPEGTVVITDPPWPEAPADLLAEWKIESAEECGDIVEDVLIKCGAAARRVVVVLGCSTDPRFLRVSRRLPFVRVCWLRYALPSPRGTILNSGDVAYVFGSNESAEDMTLLPGECTAHTPRAREGAGANMHPTARRLEHMRWLVRHFTKPTDTVLDPFCGSGTTLLAARDAGRQSIGIDRHAPYVAAIRARFDQQSLLRVVGSSAPIPAEESAVRR